MKTGGSNAAAGVIPTAPLDYRRVELCSLSHLPGYRTTRYLGVVSLHFIKESWAVRSQAELGAFFHLFLMEVNAVVRAHAAALGANALLCYVTTPEESTSRTSRNQVYHMLSAVTQCAQIC